MASNTVDVSVSVKDLDVFGLMTHVIKAAEALASAEHRANCFLLRNPSPCTCGATEERNEARTEFYRQLRVLQDRLARLKA